ncbi:MAG: type IV secretion system protein, partial [Alphaproteobacteria bacterium]|nr:type IV secretion system protein [Alphaproteobacteria bacterium]
MADQNSNISFGLSSRFLFVVAGVSILSNLVLIFALLNFFPLRKLQSFYLDSQDISEKTVYVQPFKLPKEESKVQEKVIKNLIRQYVLERERVTTDFYLLETLWGEESPLRFMSSRSVYQDFMHSPLYKQVYLLGNPKQKSRFVEIEHIDFQPTQKHWIVEGRVVDYQENGKMTQDLKIQLKADFSPNIQRMSYSNQFKNPFGFVVSAYEYLRRPS